MVVKNIFWEYSQNVWKIIIQSMTANFQSQLILSILR